jgi:hypothetical protein
VRLRGWLATSFVATLILGGMPAATQQSIEAKVQTIKETLVVMCLAGGSETAISAKGNLELSAKMKDILTGKIGAGAQGETEFSKKTWEGIIGGISKDMTAVQSQQVTEARKCMVDNGFNLLSKTLAQQ